MFLFFARPQHAQEDFEEETMEDDEAELTLNKVEEEMMVIKLQILVTVCFTIVQMLVVGNCMFIKKMISI